MKMWIGEPKMKCPICGKEVQMIKMDIFECIDCGIQIKLIFMREIYGHAF